MGFVLSQTKLYQDFNRVGFRIAATENARNINFLKYVAYIFDNKLTPPPAARSYEERKNAERQRQAEQSASGRDIAPLPEVVNSERKEACKMNFKLFCETYFPDTYAIEWSPRRKLYC